MQSVSLKKMRLISIVWGFVLFSIVAALTAFGFFYKNQTKEYKKFEELLEIKSQEYIENNGIEIDKDFKITKEELIDQKYIENALVNQKDCEAYIMVEKKENNNQYKAYIKCGDYKTKGYDQT